MKTVLAQPRKGGPEVDDLVKELMKSAGLTEAQARAAVRVMRDWLKDEKRRKTVLAAVVASTVGSVVM